MNFQKTFKDVKPPDKGSFPLDHEGECKEFMVKYVKCLRSNDNANSKCRVQSKDYLECRMNHDLMKKEDFRKLGFSDLINKETSIDNKNI
ncbi:hypothetical protein HELRODRAFT_84522 [Helobdella robusta]|uniref:Cytochrome c oxidase assembly protein COX19 n=1 Tax=Helobdella robusta TaxID=6412 RepID=T1G5J6_HELRO|nr:hypothetical protein HELRODRAFT_84522 [Helobdella robusta]ESN98537.1 hypothetical protein HELRODRAFT_84522 [Helobdella robusta]